MNIVLLAFLVLVLTLPLLILYGLGRLFGHLCVWCALGFLLFMSGAMWSGAFPDSAPIAPTFFLIGTVCGVVAFLAFRNPLAPPEQPTPRRRPISARREPHLSRSGDQGHGPHAALPS